MKTSASNFLANEFSFSRDWYVDNYKDKVPGVSGFSAGFGVDKDFQIMEISALLHYLIQTSLNFKHETIYWSTNVRANFTQNIFIAMSLNYYFREIKLGRDFYRSVVNFGIGLNLY